MTPIFESSIEQYVIELLQAQGYSYLSPEAQEKERAGLHEVVLVGRLREAIQRINPGISQDAIEQAVRQVLNLSNQSLIANNECFHRMLTDGIELDVMGAEGVKGERVILLDFEQIYLNDFVVCNQFTVTENNITKRPDVVLMINGIPLLVMELKNPADEKATVHKAFTQLQNYMQAIPSLFQYNSLLVASDGLEARAGTISSDYSRFHAWKTSDGVREDSSLVPQIETMAKGMLPPLVLLDLIHHFTVFEKSMKEDPQTHLPITVAIKKVAAYHQYHAVNKAVASTLRAANARSQWREDPEKKGLPSVKSQPFGDRKAGVVWHTQGSGKSLSMVFYARKMIFAMDNPTLVVITDRNDLDNQLFDTFANCKQLLRQDPIQAQDRQELKALLKARIEGGGIIFSTIQKFFPEDGAETHEVLSERSNVIVIADEAHRSHYGFGAKIRTLPDQQGATISYGNAKYLRDALPQASFLGFTGTPIELKDKSTQGVFGNYVDVYDIAQAVEDGATVKIYYESRLAKVHLSDEEKKKIDDEVLAVTEGEEDEISQKAKAKWAQLEAIVGHPERLKEVARDLVEHFAKRQEVFEGKGMIVCMSRRIAVELYEQIIKLRPEWHDSDLNKGGIKVIMTSSSSDPAEWQMHHTNKSNRATLSQRFKDIHDPLKLVIVRDMWLTGFDVPCLHTMYVDKAMRGHNLMQAIARVNRVFKDKPGGLIVDYIGIASDLKSAMATYAASGGKGDPAFRQEDAVALCLERLETVQQILHGFDYHRFFTANTQQKLHIILEAEEFVLARDKHKERFVGQVTALSQAFALAVPHPLVMEHKEEVGLFQAIKARLCKFDAGSGGKSDIEIETAIRQIVDRAIVSEGVVDIFGAAGIKKPDISILSDEFLEEVRHMERKNLALELLRKLLNDEIKTRSKKNLIQSKKLSEMLEKTIHKYQNNLLTSAQIIEELIQIAKEIRETEQRGKALDLNEDELAFYDALSNNASAKEVLGDKQLAVIAMEVLKSVKKNASIDWKLKESVRAKLRVSVKRILKRYGYPPDLQLEATENVLKQAELLADELND